MRLVIAALSLLVTVPAVLFAQAEGTGMRAGAWGAEVNFSGSTATGGGALLRFQTDRRALVLGLDAAYARQDRPDFFGDDENPTSVAVSARLGMRSYRTARSQIRPIIGAGLIGGTSQFSGAQRGWEAGVYGEVGIARYFGDSFSLGAMSDLQVRRSEARGSDNEKATEIRVQFDAVRIAAAVYF